MSSFISKLALGGLFLLGILYTPPVWADDDALAFALEADGSFYLLTRKLSSHYLVRALPNGENDPAFNNGKKLKLTFDFGKDTPLVVRVFGGNVIPGKGFVVYGDAVFLNPKTQVEQVIAFAAATDRHGAPASIFGVCQGDSVCRMDRLLGPEAASQMEIQHVAADWMGRLWVVGLVDVEQRGSAQPARTRQSERQAQPSFALQGPSWGEGQWHSEHVLPNRAPKAGSELYFFRFQNNDIDSTFRGNGMHKQAINAAEYFHVDAMRFDPDGHAIVSGTYREEPLLPHGIFSIAFEDSGAVDPNYWGVPVVTQPIPRFPGSTGNFQYAFWGRDLAAIISQNQASVPGLDLIRIDGNSESDVIAALEWRAESSSSSPLGSFSKARLTVTPRDELVTWWYNPTRDTVKYAKFVGTERRISHAARVQLSKGGCRADITAYAIENY